MTVLDELERLSKEATPAEWMPCGDILRNVAAIRTQSEDLFCSYGPMTMRAADNAELIATMRNNIEALIQVARAAEGYREANSMCRCKWCYEMDWALDKLK